MDGFDQHSRLVAVLIDVEHFDENSSSQLMKRLSRYPPHLILIGGSTTSISDLDGFIRSIRFVYGGKIYLFPGSHFQLSSLADGILLPSLISGRNASYLIGKHVEAAPLIAEMNLEVLSTGYMLIGDGPRTSVEYMTQSLAIPPTKIPIAVSTALAAQQIGYDSIYLEAGSGAAKPIPIPLLKKVRELVDLPIIVGGGIHAVHEVESYFESGANMVVLGSMIEKNPNALTLLHTQYIEQ